MSGHWAIAIHGGAGAIPSDLDADTQARILADLQRIVSAGTDALAHGEAALDVVEQLVERLEDDPQFNAGHGSVLCADGTHELEASIMDGATGRAGAVTLLRTTRHPIAAARLVMEQGSHVLLSGETAELLAREAGLEQVENSFFHTEHRAVALERFKAKADVGPHHATVGAVVCDIHGHVAAATSTGGMTGKLPGRIGDTPIIGAGTWADANIAVSGTGRGEDFMRFATARHVADRVALLGESVQQAADASLAAMPEGTGGLIVVSTAGEIAMPFTSAGMYRAAASSCTAPMAAIG
jgi:beta-aspartyl-peptidase (threonine type)